jgi:hypothetical protein
MKKVFLLILIFESLKSTNAQSLKKFARDTIIWNASDVLQMENFKGKPRGKKIGGKTLSGIYFHTKEDDGTIKFLVEAVFVKSKSFVRDSSKYILEHERTHFDITEVNARLMRMYIMEKDFTHVKNIQDAVSRLYQKANSSCIREQNKYDNDTEHGINPAKQEVWNKRVALELKELEAYSAIEIDIRRNNTK